VMDMVLENAGVPLLGLKDIVTPDGAPDEERLTRLL